MSKKISTKKNGTAGSTQFQQSGEKAERADGAFWGFTYSWKRDSDGLEVKP